MKPKASPEDVELFRKTVGKVKPVQQDRAVPAPAPRRRAVRARLTHAARLAALEDGIAGATSDPMVESDAVLSHRRPGVPESVLRKLRRGEYPVEGELDLHGLTLAQAKEALREFFTDALVRRARCVRIIHGKGMRSGNRGPVLKSAVNAVLRKTSAVLAYVSARPADGGTGAVYVLLSQSP